MTRHLLKQRYHQILSDRGLRLLLSSAIYPCFKENIKVLFKETLNGMVEMRPPHQPTLFDCTAMFNLGLSSPLRKPVLWIILQLQKCMVPMPHVMSQWIDKALTVTIPLSYLLASGVEMVQTLKAGGGYRTANSRSLNSIIL
ncbi:hypothetical protein QQP08_014232 [Theobroma cacao]|nr:hypothetical protein QQP08_014232 [Theobroma cacao]